MWLLAGLLFFVFIHECVPQSEFRGRDGFSGPPLRPREGFRGGPSGADVMVRTRGDRFGSGDRGVGRGAVFGECPRDRRIEGFSCYGRGTDVADCPSGSTCTRDRMSGGSYCCWERSSPVEAPCEDPRMTEDGSSFMQCVPGDSARERGGCPRCHRCQSLGRDMGMGLCCPQVQLRGCERSSPMRNAFEEARRRITGSGGLTSSSVDTGARFPDTGISDRGARDRMGSMPSPLGTDFGMTRTSGIGGEGLRVLCPNREPPMGNCSATYPCRIDQECLEIRDGIGGCCRRSSAGLPGAAGLPGRVDGSGRFMTGRTGRPGMPGVPGRPAGMVSGMTSPGVCPGGLPGISRCFSRSACGTGLTCVPFSRMEGVCCPMSGMMGAPGSPGMMGAPRSPAMMGAPGSPAMMGAPRSPGMVGAPGSPAMMGASGSPAMMGMPRSPPMMGPTGSPAMMGAPGSPAMMGAPGRPAMMGAPGSPGLMGAPRSPGMMGAPGSRGMMGSPGIERRRFSPELLARRREMMRRTLARRRMLGVGRGARF